MNTYWLSFTACTQLAFCTISVAIFLILPAERRREYLILGIFLILNMLNDIAGFIGGYLLRLNMNVVANILTLFLGVLLLSFYKRKNPSQSFSRFFWVASFILIGFGIINFIAIQGPWAANSYQRILSSFALMIATIAYFFYLLKELPTKSITTLPMFWINSALLGYSAGAFVAHIASDYLINVLQEKDYRTWIATWTIHNAVGALSYCGIIWALLLAKRSS